MFKEQGAKEQAGAAVLKSVSTKCRLQTSADLPTPDKGKSGDSTKNSEIFLFFFRLNPLSIEGTTIDTNLIPRAYSPFKMVDRHGK